MSFFKRTGLNYAKLDGVVISLDRMEQEKLAELLGDTPLEEMNHVVRCLFELWLEQNTIKKFPIKVKSSLDQLLTKNYNSYKYN